jgi:hypothetical protein
MNLGNDEEIIRPLLRAYAIATSGGIQLPSRTYLNQIAAITDMRLSEARELADEYKREEFKPENFNLNQTDDLYLGMYNATLDYGRTVNLAKLRDNVVEKGFKEEEVNGFTFKALKMSTRFGKFKKAYEYNKEYGGRKVANVNNSKLSSVEFIVKIKKGRKVQGASFNVFNTGRVRFSGGYVDGSANEPVSLVKYMEKIVNLTLSNKPIKINNVTSEIKLGANADVAQLHSLLDVGEGLAKFGGYTLKSTYEPARNVFLAKKKKDSPFLYISFDDKFTILLTGKGSMVVEGPESPAVRSPVIKRFINFLKIAGILTPTRRNVTPSPKPSKVARRANNKPAPNVTRRGTTCPKESRPVPYSFEGKCPQGQGYYVRPNPQGQPCCYKIPKRVEYMRNKVAERYRRANVKVPENVRRIFGIGFGTNEKSVNVGRKAPTNLRFEMNKNLGFKIGSRQCMRFTKVSLVDMAIRLGVALPSKVTKPVLCDLIAKHVENKKLATPAQNVGNALPVKGRNNKLRLGGRLCTSYKRSTIVKYAKELGARGEILENGTKEDLCKAIQDRANAIKRKNEGNENFNYFMNLAKQLKNKNR